MSRLNIFSLSLLAVGMAMLIPAIAAWGHGEKNMLIYFVVSAVIAYFLAFALHFVVGRKLLAEDGIIPSFLAIWGVAPAMTAVPIYMAMPEIGAVGAYFEAISAFTTTGASANEQFIYSLSSLILWQYICALMGGMGTLAMALAALSPTVGMRRSRVERNPGAHHWPILQALKNITPHFLLVLLLVFALFALVGLPSFDAFALAVSVLTSTGFTPQEAGLAAYGKTSYLIEIILAAFLPLALVGALLWERPRRVLDASYMLELRPLILILAFAIAIIVLSHPQSATLEVIWASTYSALSYITTTGLQSSSWQLVSSSTGIETILLTLAFVGGGIGSAAGGVKLLRIWSLQQRGSQELAKMVFPNGVERWPNIAPEVLSAAHGAWVVAAFYAASIAGFAGLLSLTGESLHVAALGALSGIVNIGPALPSLAPEAGGYTSFNDSGKMILALAMIAGRADLIALAALSRQWVYERYHNAQKP